MNARDIAKRKSIGNRVSVDEIDFMVRAYTKDQIKDAEMSSFLYAIKEHGMDFGETLALTRSMVASGRVVDLEDVPPPRVDKHSTGGVGDKTTLVVGPLAAAAGLYMAKMSGRSLGHTGGTLDKLESIPGINVSLNTDRFIEQTARIGLAITAQTTDLVPVDKKIYALREKTGTMASIPLIASSVMSKKLAAGADFIILDVKVGTGAFMKSFAEAKELAEMCVGIGNIENRRTVALITNMNQVLGRAVGPVLEVKEAIETLKGHGPKDVTELSMELTAQLLIMSGQALNKDDARGTMMAELEGGQALDRLAEMIWLQGGDPRIISNPDLLPRAHLVECFTSQKAGYVSAMDAEKIGWAAKETEGIYFHKKIGDEVSTGDIIADIHVDTHNSVDKARSILGSAITVSDQALGEPLIMSVIR